VLRDAVGHSAIWFWANQMPLKNSGQENVYYWLTIEIADILQGALGT
jgi:hypothetical protein